MTRRLPTVLDGLILLEPELHGDDRGFFLETFHADRYAELGVTTTFVQDNQSRSRRGTLRGLHFQRIPGQAKLISVVRGRIWDVAVDIRPHSPSFGRYETFELDDAAHRQLYVPVGFAHGFCVQSELADVAYKVSSYYEAAEERGVAWDDPDLGIPWPSTDLIISSRDRANPRFRDVAAHLQRGSLP